MNYIQHILFFVVLSFSAPYLKGATIDDLPFDKTLEEALNKNPLLSDSLLDVELLNLEKLDEEEQFWVLFLKLTSDFVTGENELDTIFINKQSLSPSLESLLTCTYKLDKGLPLSDKEQHELKVIERNEGLFYYLLAQFNLGRASALKSDFNAAINYFEQVATGSRRTNKKVLASRCLFELSRLYYAERLLERAYSFSQKALRKARLNNEQAWESIYLNQLGEIQLEIGNSDVAKEFFIDARNAATKFNLAQIKAIAKSNLGQVYILEKRYSDAINQLQDALGILYRLDNDEEVAKAHLRIGKSYFNVKQYDLARDNYKLGLNIAASLQDELKTAVFHSLLGRLYTVKNDFNKALSHISQAITIQKKMGASLQLSISFTYAAALYSKQQQFEKAFHYLTKHKELTDSLQAAETQRKIAELNSLFQSEHKELLILEQQKELEEKTNEQLIKDQELENKELRNQQLYFLITAIVLLFIIVFIALTLKNKQDKLKQEHKALELQQTIFRSQMNPHFIFNAMSVIQSYIYENDNEKSSKLLVNFSKLMRLILENSSKEFIPLTVELEILERYLKIQKIRFENRFSFEINTENINNTEAIGVPPMLMQPFIENAIEHGRLDQIKGGLIKIGAVIQKDLIVLTIEDNGIGINKAKQYKKDNQHKSMAMDITQERINLLNMEHNANGSMQIKDLSESGKKGTSVTIKTVYRSNFVQE